MRDAVQKLIQFIAKSPTCYHAVSEVRERLSRAGLEELREGACWTLQPGGRYFTIRNDASLLAFTLPEEPVTSLRIAAAHTDSPCFRIKGLTPEIAVEDQYLKLNTEPYGGLLMAPWFDRALSVAGRIVTAGGLRTILVHIDRDLLMIPSVAIHMDRDANKGKEYKAQTDLLPLFAEAGSEKSFRQLVAETAGISNEDLLAADLFVYNRTPGTVWGANGEFFSAPRIDDLECVYALTQGFLSAVSVQNQPVSGAGCLKILALFHNEEVGNRSLQGADSTFMTDTIARIRESLGLTGQQLRAAIANGWMISADNAHALHPNHPELHDPQNHPRMNGGPVIKFAASQRYTTDAVSAAFFKDLCRRADVPYQEFYNRSDSPGGSTLGNAFNSHLSIRSVDIGLAQLAMHSPYETAGVRDLPMLIRVMEEFYR